jgi:hypothetical protein
LKRMLSGKRADYSTTLPTDPYVRDYPIRVFERNVSYPAIRL